MTPDTLRRCSQCRDTAKALLEQERVTSVGEVSF
jgi:hypothetical protein